MDPKWAPIIKENFFNAFEMLGSAGAVQKELARLGIWVPDWKSRTGKVHPSKPFEKQQVIRVLRNEIYLGRIKWGDASRDDCHEPIISHDQFDRVQALLRHTTRKRENHRYARGRGYILRGLVRCGCSAMMTPKGAGGRNATYSYYECTRQIHGGRSACGAARIPAEALEKAVIGRVRQIGSTEAARERIVQQALSFLDDDIRLVENDSASARRRLGEVQGRIKNLVGVLAMLGEESVASIKEELGQLEVLKAALRDKLEELAAKGSPRSEGHERARRFAQTWNGVGDILSQATPTSSGWSSNITWK